jgi:TPR repeat protein
MDKFGRRASFADLQGKMKSFTSLVLILAGLLLTGTGVHGAPLPGNTAEQWIASGDSAQKNGDIAKALANYRRAATAGNVNGAFAAGELLSAVSRLEKNRNNLLNHAEALEYLLFAATNRHAGACVGIAEAFQNGYGVRTNLTSAYCWQLVAAHFDPAYKQGLDSLVLRLEPDQIMAAQNQARDFLAGHWPDRIMRKVDQGDSRLQIQGFSFSPRGPLVILNGETLAIGESINVHPVNEPNNVSGTSISVSCYEAGSDYLLVSIGGDPNLKLLPITSR